MNEMPATIEEYLDRLRGELASCDPALVQDLLFDAEEYLRNEMDGVAPRGAALAAVIERYGTPEEVAEPHVAGATGSPPRQAAKSSHPELGSVRRFLSVMVDPRAYASFFYLLLSMVTGVFSFTWVTVGLSLSLGFAVLVIGLPFFLLFLGTVRALALVEGSTVEGLLGIRMPRRLPFDANAKGSILERARALASDPATWSTMLYLALKMPLGIVYFALAVTLLSVSVGLLLFPVTQLIFPEGPLFVIDGDGYYPHAWTYPVVCVIGFALLVTTLHVARGIGRVHGNLAKSMLVRA